MKKLLALAVLMAASSAFAENTATNNTTTNSTSEASNAGNSQQITINMPATETRELTRSIVDQNIGGTQTIRNTPSVSGPQLTSSNDTCMGSSSGSVNAPGIGVSLGTTWTDQNCKMLKNSRELWNMGMKAAALALMCTDSANREALELTGFKCPTKKEDKPVVQASGEQYTDPIVRARLGLPPLK